MDTFAQVAAVMEGPRGAVHLWLDDLDADVQPAGGDVPGDEKGMIRLEGGPFNANVNDLAEVELHQNGNRVTVERFPTANHYKLQVEAFGRRCGRVPPIPARWNSCAARRR